MKRAAEREKTTLTKTRKVLTTAKRNVRELFSGFGYLARDIADEDLVREGIVDLLQTANRLERNVAELREYFDMIERERVKS